MDSTLKRHLLKLSALMFATMLLQVTANSNPPQETLDNVESLEVELFSNITNDCECVPFYLCINDTINVFGTGILDLRDNSRPCSTAIEKCCKTVGNPPKPKSIKDPTCGRWNSNGVGFKIVGDTQNEAQFGEFPWMMAILNLDPSTKIQTNVCVGSLIHPNVVLTAAHSLHKIDEKNLVIRAGEWDTRIETEIFKHQDRHVLKIIKHEQFDFDTSHNDVALIIVDEPFSIVEHVGTICLPSQDFVFPEERCFASGWGKNAFGKTGENQNILKKIDLPIVPRGPCLELLRKTRLTRKYNLPESLICAGGEVGKDTCTGDGGGPLMCAIDEKSTKFVQAGIVAWGVQCNTATPGVYVDVTKFRNWIDTQMVNENLEKKYYDPEYIPNSATGIQEIQMNIQDKIEETFADFLTSPTI